MLAAFLQGKREGTIDEVSRFVHRYIAKKNLRRGYDLASVVARRQEGDCTEHAVLLAALARSLGIPARVVHGIVLVEQAGQAFAFGHAWVEYGKGAKWLPADAALIGVEGKIYLPVGVVEDEGPSFVIGIATSMNGLLFIERLKLEDAAKQ